MEQQLAAVTRRRDLMNDSELQEQSHEFLGFFREALQSGDASDITGAA